ncbi:hypothetical protein HDU98_011930 [Podochytrium sp. JEL0797]|nr:hypothetical protein HDU98_011930 [Podochytrium sp. JEL0797]
MASPNTSNNGASLLRCEDIQTIMRIIGMGSAAIAHNLASPLAISGFKVHELKPLMEFLTTRLKGHEATHNLPTAGIKKYAAKPKLVEYVTAQLYGSQFHFVNGAPEASPGLRVAHAASVAAAGKHIEKMCEEARAVAAPAVPVAPQQPNRNQVGTVMVCQLGTCTRAFTSTGANSHCNLSFCSPACLKNHNESRHQTRTPCILCKTVARKSAYLCPLCRQNACSPACLLTHRARTHPTPFAATPAAHPLPTRPPTLTKPHQTQTPTPSVTEASLSSLIERVTTNFSSTHDVLAVWKTSATSGGSLFNRTPSPIRISFPITRVMMESVLDFSSPNAVTVRPDVHVWWHFYGTDGVLPSASCMCAFPSVNVSLGGIHAHTEKLDITQSFRAQGAALYRSFQSNSPASLVFTVQFSSSVKAKLHSIQTAIIVHKKLDPTEYVAKLYHSILIGKGLVRPDVSADPALKLLHLRPSVARNLETLQKRVLESCCTEVSAGGAAAKANEDEICVGNSTITFSCPLSLVRIKHPSKGKKCKHKQVFDAATFLAFNEKNEIWKCIVCKEKIERSDLLIDTTMLRLLQKYPNADKCIVNAAGQDSPFSDTLARPTNIAATPAGNTPTVRRPILIDLDDDSVANRRHSSPVFGGSFAGKRHVVVLDDSDDEIVPPKRRNVNTFNTERRMELDGRVVETIVLD